MRIQRSRCSRLSYQITKDLHTHLKPRPLLLPIGYYTPCWLYYLHSSSQSLNVHQVQQQ